MNEDRDRGKCKAVVIAIDRFGELAAAATGVGGQPIILKSLSREENRRPNYFSDRRPSDRPKSFAYPIEVDTLFSS